MLTDFISGGNINKLSHKSDVAVTTSRFEKNLKKLLTNINEYVNIINVRKINDL